jgi:hypothetical protein
VKVNQKRLYDLIVTGRKTFNVECSHPLSMLA